MNRKQPSNPGAALRNATLVQPDECARRPLFLAEGRIAASSPVSAWECDLRDHLIFPGLVNAHDHLHLNAFPPLEFTEPFPNSYAWIAAFQSYLESSAVAMVRAVPTVLRHWHGALKNLLCGVTTVAHHDPWHPVFEETLFPVRVLRDFGWSHSLGLGLPNAARCALVYGPSIAESFAATPPTQPWIIHLAEGTDEVAAAELRALDAIGCLAANTVLVHGVGLSESDRDRLLAAGGGVVWCPGSNLAMLGRTLNPRRLLDAGRLALGSDARISGGGDLLRELRLAAAHSDATPAELLRLVTEASHRLLRLPEVGGLTPGQWADLLIVRDTGTTPHRCLLELWRADIRAVVRGGVPILADSDFADWFSFCGIAVTPVRLDGCLKLCATAALGLPGVTDLEPGLEILEAVNV